MSTWVKQKLGNVVDINLRTINKDFPHHQIEYVDISSVGTGKLESITLLNLSEAPSRAKRLVENGDTILATVRPNRRSFLYVKNPPKNRVVSTGFAVLTPSKIDSRFLYYIICQQEFTDYLSKNAKGAAYPAIDEEIINRADVLIPDPTTQTRIGSLLSAYDDLIEINEKRIKILEEMAERLYNEWFVKFKFPGHEKIKMIESGAEYEKIPEGWEIKTVEKVFKILGGGTPSRSVSEYWRGEINWYTPSDITATNQMFTDRSLEQISELGLKKSSAKLFPPYSIMMTSRATIGAISINTFYSTTNQGFIVCIPNEKSTLCYLYYWLKQHVPLFIELGSGATFKEISKGNFKKIKILLPRPDLINQFESKLKISGDLILRLQRENRTLAKIRNLLIPQLVSGRRELKIK